MVTAENPYLSPVEQRELASRAQQGDGAAFGSLYEHFREALTGYVLGRMNSPDDAQDIVSETFTTALKLLREGRYDSQYSVYTFLKAIADGQISHYLRTIYAAVPSGQDSEALRYVQRLRPLGVIPEIATLPSQEIEIAAYELVLLVLSCGAKPHQALSFCLIGMFDWRPREVVEHLGSRSLFALTRRVYDDVAHAVVRHSPHRVICRDHCRPFWQKLVALVPEVYTEQEYRHLCAHRGPVGDLILSAFLGRRPAASVSDWCHKVRTRARNALESGILQTDEDRGLDHRRS